MPKGLDRCASRGQGFRHEEGQHAQRVLVGYREKAGEEFGGADGAVFERDQKAFLRKVQQRANGLTLRVKGGFRLAAFD